MAKAGEVPYRRATGSSDLAAPLATDAVFLKPSFTLIIHAEGSKLFSKATRQAEVELSAESPDKFFLKIVDARIGFYPEADGSVKRMKLFQGGEMEGKRIK